MNVQAAAATVGETVVVFPTDRLDPDTAGQLDDRSSGILLAGL